MTNGRTNASRMSSEHAGAGSPFSRATFTFESACIRIRFGSHSLFSRSRDWDSDRCWFAYDSVVNACSQAIHSMFRQCITSVPHTAEIHSWHMHARFSNEHVHTYGTAVQQYQLPCCTAPTTKPMHKQQVPADSTNATTAAAAACTQHCAPRHY
jgi:hypothetical protein